MVAALALAALVATLAAAAVDSVTITGRAVVGETLTAQVERSGKPGKGITYSWLHCVAESPYNCTGIKDATGSTYVVADADVGYRLAVLAREGKSQKISPATDVVTPAPAPAPTPTPTATPTPTPTPTSSPTPPFNQTRSNAAPTSVTTPTVPLALRFLRPFPVVRIKGRLARAGAVVTLLRVTAPRGSTVRALCRGARCPLRDQSVGVGRISALERYLRAGTRITIRVRQRGLIGKYARIVIREGRAPARRDACLLPGRRSPVRCPRP